jgi:hypothetical protein
MRGCDGGKPTSLSRLHDLGVEERKAKKWWPNLAHGAYAPTSEYDGDYNCIAWAMRDKRRWWEPSGRTYHYWPNNATPDYSLEAHIEAFRTRHYEPCDNGNLEPGFEKLAIFWREGNDAEDGFKHVARQLSDGQWTSKLGPAKDIRHQTLDALVGDYYGDVIQYMRRPRAQTPTRQPRRTRARQRRRPNT